MRGAREREREREREGGIQMAAWRGGIPANGQSVLCCSIKPWRCDAGNRRCNVDTKLSALANAMMTWDEMR